MNKEIAQLKDKQVSKDDASKVWDEAIADTERKIEGYKGRIASLRTTGRILRGLKKKSSAGKN